MKLTKYKLAPLAIFCVLVSGVFSTESSAADYADARIPQVKSIDIDFVFENGGIYAVSNLEVEVKNNGIKKWLIGFFTPDSYSPSPLKEPCKLPWGNFGLSFSQSGDIGPVANQTVKLRGKFLVSSSIINMKFCPGTYKIANISIIDEAHQTDIAKYCTKLFCKSQITSSDPEWVWGVRSPALEAAPLLANCPKQNGNSFFTPCDQNLENILKLKLEITENFIPDLYEKSLAADKAAADKAAADKAAADKAAADKAAADKAAASNAFQLTKTTISCVKGKLVKKVSGVNPKCPVGYKKK